MRNWILFALMVLIVSIPSAASAQVTFGESINGDLGDPTDGSITILGELGVGENTVAGTLDNTIFFLDRDSFTFTIAEGLQLDSLFFTSFDGGGHFYALSNRDMAVTTNSASGNYYASLIGSESVGVNLLDGTENNSGGSGGSGPLTAGDYSFWIQETDFSVVNYSLSLTTSTAVPEPGSAIVLVFSGGLMLLRRYRKTDS